MKRTKPTKTQKNKLAQIPHINLGGHMPYPPEKCKATRMYDWQEIEYIDCSACASCKDKCQRWKDFQNEWKEYWKIYKEIKGVKNGD